MYVLNFNLSFILYRIILFHSFFPVPFISLFIFNNSSIRCFRTIIDSNILIVDKLFGSQFCFLWGYGPAICFNEPSSWWWCTQNFGNPGCQTVAFKLGSQACPCHTQLWLDCFRSGPVHQYFFKTPPSESSVLICKQTETTALRSANQCRVTQLVGGRAGIWIHVLWFQNPNFLTLCWHLSSPFPCSGSTELSLRWL